ncbi:putative iron-regulated membrane protein [Novosphingobium hassiacum]|uniref:Putative iron-regulated membrane protein n=1 Tax=Novosphingobium hassiacum TaxID=173676 RepID=A0A7W6A0B0_9SPHN|nr:PepSY domain-containing protein [Novosphingobium hassiacum]MBB3862227.1 putative iron-regulated membrane protein [Novosphingobium hassiacum]
MNRESKAAAIYRKIWRWHFYAGLFVMPMIAVLSITGAIYLFKPQIDAWEERAFAGLPTRGSVAPEAQVAAALSAFPGKQMQAYRLPARTGDAAMILLSRPNDRQVLDVFVSPQGKVLGSIDPATRIAQIAHDVHGQLLLGRRGSWLVELAASWAIVMILSGLYLWWPRRAGLGGVVWPRFGRGRRTLLRDVHAVTGFWVAGLALVLLATGLPWASVWGSGFKAVRSELGLVKGRQAWSTGGEAAEVDPHAMHDHNVMAGPENSRVTRTTEGPTLSTFVAKAQSQHLPFPVMIVPPGAPQAFGAPPRPDWTVRSDTQNRPLAQTLRFDAATGALIARETFADSHPIDRIVGYGIAWHEGALFGVVNQIIGLATALMLITLSVSGFLMWRRQKARNRLGAPLPATQSGSSLKLLAIIVGLAALLPMLAISIPLVLAIEWLLLRRIPGAARWLGLDEGASPP